MQVLRRVWVQQYYRDHVGRTGVREAKDLPPGLLSIGSPYDAEARYSGDGLARVQGSFHRNVPG
ncbi:hypothetical protein [Streptomyces sp. NPDC058735]|uniref:hypothetical protein n=1 Tax=unclassified Streptomyces TaxID=2593676 RepID=UPI00367B4C18